MARSEVRRSKSDAIRLGRAESVTSRRRDVACDGSAAGEGGVAVVGDVENNAARRRLCLNEWAASSIHGNQRRRGTGHREHELSAFRLRGGRRVEELRGGFARKSQGIFSADRIRRAGEEKLWCHLRFRGHGNTKINLWMVQKNAPQIG